MLRSRSGTARFQVINKETQQATHIDLDDYLTKKQRRKVCSYPDFAWQFAQHLKQEYAQKGEDVRVYVNCRAKVNGSTLQPLIDPNVDLAAVPWKHFAHNEWILPRQPEKSMSKN